MLSRIDCKASALHALCLTPSRELANQIISEALLPLAKHMVPAVIIEGAIQGTQKPRGERSRAHVVVGTPGKTMQWVQQKYLLLTHLRVFVLDEADAMVANSEMARSLGADTLKMHSMLPFDAQILFFSATYTPEVVELARTLVPRAAIFRLHNAEESVLSVITQLWIDTTTVPDGKLGALKEIFTRIPIQQSIVFVERRNEADRVSTMMTTQGYDVSTLHSDLVGVERDRVMADFREQRTRVLITTNVLARGVDVESIGVVINYDLPVLRHGHSTLPDPVTYLHRIGRTGRFGREGIALNFIQTADEYNVMKAIEKHFSPHHEMIAFCKLEDIAKIASKLHH